MPNPFTFGGFLLGIILVIGGIHLLGYAFILLDKLAMQIIGLFQ